MAGFKRIYTSENQYLEDIAKSTNLFDYDFYETAKETGKSLEYLTIMASAADGVSSSFDKNIYDRLSGIDRFNYYTTENLLDKGSDEYKRNKEYFDQQIEAIKNQEIYDSLNGFEKTLATVSGWFGSLGLGVYGLGEGLIDAAALIGGGVAGLFDNQIWEDTKDFIAKDTTGYNAAQKALTEFRQTYTFENKQQWMGAINDVFGAIGQMAPMLVTGGASAVVKGIGTAAYYVGMAGNTAEQAVLNNPDIDYWKLVAYTGAVTGVEALTEWGSGKIFGEGLIGLKGFNPKQISGGMFKTILHNMGTEAAEEAVSELFGGILEYYLVTEDRESLPTLEKVLYAALIGGITGGVLAGGRITLTPRMSVTSDGQVKYDKDLTTEERNNAKKLGLRKSWAVQSLLQQSSDALNRVDEVTKLQTKYNTLSLDQIKTQHADEYQTAVDSDIEIKTKQAKSFLSLAKLMHEIGETNFKEAVDLLNGAVEDAERMIDNYINHRAEGNKKASEIFSANFPNRSFTPSTIPSKTNQMLAEAIRKAFPNLNVAFGTFGDKEGDPVRAINGTETYLFIDENFAAKHGTQALVEAVRYQLADQLMSEMEIFDKAEVDGLVRLFTDTDVPYSKLSKEQKRTIAQILCFDAVNTRKLFRNSSKTHRKIFKYFTDQSEYVKKFGRQTEANKIRYHDLLSIRNMYIQNIVDTIGNMEDVRTIAKEYGITEDELKTKIIDKMITTNANDKVKLTKLHQVKEACQKRDAFNELYQSRIDTTEDFDFSRMYDPEYYSEDFVNTVSQGNADFKQALNEYILRQHGIVFVDKTEFDVACESMISSEMVEEFSKEFLTKEYLDTNPSFADKKTTVIDALYMFSQVGTDSHGDSVIVTDAQIQGTGRLSFINPQLFAEKPTFDSEFVEDTSQKKVKKQPNITEVDIENLADQNYKSGKKEKSEAKGYEDVEYEVASVIEYEQQNDLTLRKIKTFDDLKLVLNAVKTGKIGQLEGRFLMDLLQSRILARNFKGDRYTKAKEILKEYQAAEITKSAQELASRSQLFSARSPMKSLVDELNEKYGQDLQVSDKMMIKWVPMYADRTNWLNRLNAQYEELFDKRKHEKDPYKHQQYTDQLTDLRKMIQAVAENDTATILDLTIRQLEDTDENKAKNSEKVQELIKDFVAELIAHTDVSGKTVKYDSSKKYILKPETAEKVVNFWNKVNAFRYLALLSSPATWGRNAVTNTLVAVNAIVEDGISKNFEKSMFLRHESQAYYTGDYDSKFAEFVEKRYKERINKDTKGDKYNVREIDQVRQEWAAENDPLKKSKLLYKIKQIEQKGLNDQPWTTRRVMRNLKNTLAGSMNLISKNAYAEIKAMYKGDSTAEILDNMRDKKSPLTELFEQVYVKNNGNDMIGTIELASQLSHTSSMLDQIYNNALYRGNKLLFKTDNILSEKLGKLQKKHPMTAAFISAFIPFAKTSYNTTMYIANHSPIGLVKGLVKGLQTKNMYYGDMRQEIRNYHKNEYVKQHKEADKEFKFNEQEFMEWANTHLHSDVISAMNGDYKMIKQVFDRYVELGRVNQSQIGSTDIFARANTIESITQGLTGTAWMLVGIILGALCDGFKIDEDDYLGPVLVVGNLRFKLDDLSPFSTMFSVGAVVNSSDGFLDAFEKFAGILVDASMLNVVESAIQYSDNLTDYLGNQSINFVQQFIPAIFKSFTKVIDNSKKNKSGNFFEKLIKTTAANTPLLSYLVADKIDPYTGEKEKIYQSGLLEALLNQGLPVGIRTQTMSDFEREARKIGAETTGFTGRFSVNDTNYTVKDKNGYYAKYRADYIEKQFDLITSGKLKVTVEDDNGKRIETTYNKLTDKQKKNVINRLYSDATNNTKIKWWTDLGNKYVVTNRDLYNEYRSLFKNIVYKETWNKSKFVES